MADPRIAVIPDSVKTAGPKVARLAAMAGIHLDQAQRLIADAMSGVGADGKWSAFEGVCFAPRQCGKTEYLLARILAGLFLFGEELVLYSAHQSRTTSEVFRRIRRAVEESPELGGRIARVNNRPGGETIELASGQRLQCVARSTSTGRGYTADAVVFDEAHNLDSEELAAVLPALATRRNPQVIYGLSMGTEDSTHLGALRARALDREPGIAWVEWSMAEGDRVDDREVWRRCNPAVEAGRITLRYLEREFASLGPLEFARERLGKSNWPTDQTGRFAVVSRAAWRACEDEDADALTHGRPCFGVAVSRDGRTGAIVACGIGQDGLPVLEVADWKQGDGAGWIGPRLADLVSRYDAAAVCWDGDSLAGPLALESYCGRARVMTPKPGELAAACGALMYAFEDRAARHRGDDRLTAAVGAAQIRPSRSAWYWRDDSHAAEILQAATWALHAVTSGKCPYDLLKSVC